MLSRRLAEVFVLVWDDVAWHVCTRVRKRTTRHNRRVQKSDTDLPHIAFSRHLRRRFEFPTWCRSMRTRTSARRPVRHLTHLNLAECYRQAGDTAWANEHAEKAQWLAPNR